MHTFGAAIVATLLVAGWALRRRAVTRGAALVLLTVAAVTLLEGGPPALWLVLSFFGLAVLSRKLAALAVKSAEAPKTSVERRTVCDSLPISLGLIAGATVVQRSGFSIAPIAAVLAFGLTDIYAGEFGPRLSRGPAFSLFPPARVPHGTSGAVSLAGSLSGAIAGLYPLVYAWAIGSDTARWSTIFLPGIAGAAADTIILSALRGRTSTIPRDRIHDIANAAGVALALALSTVML